MIVFNLKEILTRKNLTLTQVHEATGISKNTLSLINTGTSKGIQFDTLNKLLEFLAIDIQDLLVFVSQKEIDALNLKIDDLDINSISTPPGSWLEEEIITNVIEVSKKIKINITYGELLFSFDDTITFFSEAVSVENKDKIRETEAYQGEDGDSLDDALFYVEKNNVNFINFSDNINKINLSRYQKEILEDKLAQETEKIIPVEIKNFVSKNDSIDNKILINVDNENVFNTRTIFI